MIAFWSDQIMHRVVNAYNVSMNMGWCIICVMDSRTELCIALDGKKGEPVTVLCRVYKISVLRSINFILYLLPGSQTIATSSTIATAAATCSLRLGSDCVRNAMHLYSIAKATTERRTRGMRNWSLHHCITRTVRVEIIRFSPFRSRAHMCYLTTSWVFKF